MPYRDSRSEVGGHQLSSRSEVGSMSSQPSQSPVISALRFCAVEDGFGRHYGMTNSQPLAVNPQTSMYRKPIPGRGSVESRCLS